MHSETVSYQVDKIEFEGFLAFDETQHPPQPGIVLAHAWKGHDAFVREKAIELAKLGYVAFAADVYGKGVKAKDNEEALALMTPLFKDREILRKRIAGSLDILKNQERVDENRLGAIGFCFGGLTVFELVRSGAEIRGAVSFHGLLGDQLGEISAKRPSTPRLPNRSILFLHGYEDPLVSDEEIKSVQEELTNAGVDWQMHIYGQTAHAFTNPLATEKEAGLYYQPQSSQRAWQAMKNYFEEVLK